MSFFAFLFRITIINVEWNFLRNGCFLPKHNNNKLAYTTSNQPISHSATIIMSKKIPFLKNTY